MCDIQLLGNKILEILFTNSKTNGRDANKKNANEKKSKRSKNEPDEASEEKAEMSPKGNL